MNKQALQIYRNLSEKEVEIKLYKEYMEKLFPCISNVNIEQYWNSFLEITREMVTIFVELGYHSIIDFYNNRMCGIDITEQLFKNIMSELYTVATEFVNDYEKNIRCCASCNEKVYYLPLPEHYHHLRKKYQVPKSKSETLNDKEYICPICGSLDRDRLIISYLSRCDKLNLEDISLLQIAPSKAIETFIINQYPNLNYDSGDLYMEGVTFRIDLQDMKLIPDESYDMWICSHVLEHVPDDRKALRELYRILKPKGIGILLVPIDLNMIVTDEELGCTEEENWRRFGQGDHVRKYAKNDFIKKITDSGFSLECLSKEYFGEQVFKENGLSETATLYVVKK